MNVQSIIVLLIVAVAVILAVVVYRKKGSSCSCGEKCDGSCNMCNTECNKSRKQ